MKDFNSIEKEQRQKIAEKLKELVNDPIKFARKLTNPKIGTYRFRVGEYRVVFDIEDNKTVILRIGHRKSVYK